jgi:hypothetical protein
MPARSVRDLRRTLEPLAPPVANLAKPLPPPIGATESLPEKIEQRKRNLKAGRTTP